MTKYLLKRILRGLISVGIVVGVVMVLIYSCLDRTLIFANDPNYNKQKSNTKNIYQMQQWEKYGYVDYVPYADYLTELLKNGEIDEATYKKVVRIADTPERDSDMAQEYIEKFTEAYKNKGYEVVRLNAEKMGNRYKDGGKPRLYAYRNIPLVNRLGAYLSNLITIDNIHYVKEDIENRGIQFTFFDPVYGGKKFSPAIMGNGTEHKYLLYFDGNFPYIHQNLINFHLGTSYTGRQGVDVVNILGDSQGSYVYSSVTYPTGLVAESADDLHTATYVAGSLENGNAIIKRSFVDDYTNVGTHKNGLSKTGYSFTIGIISVLMSYLIAIPLGITMALKKDKLVDKLGTVYIVFIIAVPSLAYIFLFKSLGGKAGLPTTFDMENPIWLMYVLPIVSLALPAIANLMKWLRRYMIDQMNADYVKFARSGGLSEGEIFSKHILKNAIIPIVHGIPASMLGAMTGAIITERVYVVPGAGNLLTTSINSYDNGAIVGVTLFYALLSVVSVILGDVLMSMMDPRISFVTKER